MPEQQNVNTGAPRADLLANVGALLDTARKRADRAGNLGPPIVGAAAAIDQCVKLLARSRARFAALLNQSGEALGAIADSAMGSVSAGVELRGRANAATEAAAGARSRAIAALRGRVAAEFQDEATRVAMAGQDALTNLQRAIDGATLDASTYSALTAAPDAGAAARLEKLTVQVKAGGLDRLSATYGAYLQAADDEKLIDLEEAATAWLQEVVAGPPVIAAGQRRARDAGGDRMKAAALLNLFDGQRARRMPPQIALARLILDNLLKPAWFLAVGITGNTATPTQMVGMTQAGSIVRPFDIGDSWQLRSFTRVTRGIFSLGEEGTP